MYRPRPQGLLTNVRVDITYLKARNPGDEVDNTLTGKK